MNNESILNRKSAQLYTFPTYSFQERDRRWNLARKFMEENGLEAMTFVFEPNCAFGRSLVTVGGTILINEMRL
jgi:hypothetical protein